MDMHFRLKNETSKDALKIEFQNLEFLRPSFFSSNLQFLDDYTVVLKEFKISTFEEKDKGLTISGNFPLYNKIMVELKKLLKFEKILITLHFNFIQ